VKKHQQTKSDITNNKLGNIINNNFETLRKEIFSNNLPGNNILKPLYTATNKTFFKKNSITPYNNSNNINNNNNNNSNYMLNPTFKSEDENVQSEKSTDKDLTSLTSDIRSLKQLSKINNKDKHNLIKIIDMYMKDDKKAKSKLKLSTLHQSSKKKKSIF